MKKNKNLTMDEVFNLAVKNHQEGKTDIAQNLYNKVLEIDPNHLQTLNNLGIIFLGLGENQKAKECYEKIIEINPNYAEAHNNLGNIFQKLEENQKAKECYEKAIVINPNYADAHYNLGVIFQNLGEHQKTKKCFEQVIKINPNYVNAHNNLGIIFQGLGENQKAKDYFEKAIEINPNYAIAHNNLGNISKSLGEHQKAKECFEQVIKINPNYVNAHNNLGIIFQGLGENQKAKDCFEKAIVINPNHVNAHNNLGIIFQGLGEHQKAKECYEKAIEIDPNYVNAHYNLGIIFQKLGENEKAKECYEKTIEINPNFADAINNLGNIFLELGEYQKAKYYFEKAIEINPNQAHALNNLGVIFQKLGQHQKAKECYEKAIKIAPDLLDASSNLANIYVSQLTNFEIAISKSNETLKKYHKNYKFIDQSISLFRLKHDIEQANYLNSKNYKINGIDEFIKIGDEILGREENEEDKNNHSKKILLNNDEINSLLPYSKKNHIYQTKTISGSCINPNKNWLDVEDEYLNSANQIMYIDDFLSDEALQELREFCLVSKVWYKEYNNKYLGAFSDSGFISPIHLQIATDLQQKLPKLFGPHKIEKFWGFKYDATLGKGINIHADDAIHNLNFWITPNEFNNNKKSGGLKVYDAPAPDNWSFRNYNMNPIKIYKFLKENNANCTNVPYKFNRAVLFNSAYFHETDEIDFKNEYEGRRINNTYLFGKRLVKSSLD